MNEIIKLDNGRMYAEILVSRGANPIKLIDRELGADILRSPRELSDFVTDNPYLYGMPPLFFPNRISGGRFSFGGKEYVLPVNEAATGCYLHGTLHETAFSVVEQKKDRVTCVYEAKNSGDYLGFPHAFAFYLTYALEDNALLQIAEFRNDSSEEMPVALAFHTTFNTPFIPSSRAESIKAKIGVCREFLRDKNYLPTGEILCESKYIAELSSGEFCPADNVISAFFEDGGERRAVLTDEAAGVALVHEASEGYGYFMVYNGGAKNFFCVEAQTWATNCPNLAGDIYENGFQTVAPKKTRRYVTKTYCEKLKT